MSTMLRDPPVSTRRNQVTFSVVSLFYFLITMQVFKAPLSVLVSANTLNVVCLLIVFSLCCVFLVRKITLEQLAALCLLVWVLIRGLVSLVWPYNGVSYLLVVINTAQQAFPLLLLLALFGANRQTLEKTSVYAVRVGYVLAASMLIEVTIVPAASIRDLASFALGEKLGTSVALDAFTERTFGIGWSRPGSLIFDPVAASMIVVSGLMAIDNLSKKVPQRILLSIAVILSAVKSAIVVFCLSIFFKLSRRAAAFFGVALSCGALLWFWGDVLAIASGHRIFGFESISNHLLGLYFGIKNTLELPFSGHGMGSAGYLILLKCKELGITGPFAGAEGGALQNGNESGLGMTVFQLGVFYGLAVVAMMAVASYRFYKKGDYSILGLSVGYMVFYMFSESSMSFSIQAIVFPIVVYRYRFGTPHLTYSVAYAGRRQE